MLDKAVEILVGYHATLIRAMPDKTCEESYALTKVDQPISMDMILHKRPTMMFLLCVHGCTQWKTNRSVEDCLFVDTVN